MGRSGLWVLGLGGAADLGQWRKPPEGALVAVFVSLLYGKRIEKNGYVPRRSQSNNHFYRPNLGCLSFKGPRVPTRGARKKRAVACSFFGLQCVRQTG